MKDLLDSSKMRWLLIRLNKYWDRFLEKSFITKSLNSQITEVSICQEHLTCTLTLLGGGKELNE